MGIFDGKFETIAVSANADMAFTSKSSRKRWFCSVSLSAETGALQPAALVHSSNSTLNVSSGHNTEH